MTHVLFIRYTWLAFIFPCRAIESRIDRQPNCLRWFGTNIVHVYNKLNDIDDISISFDILMNRSAV